MTVCSEMLANGRKYQNLKEKNPLEELQQNQAFGRFD